MFIENFISAFIGYTHELWWILAIGFLLSGIFYHIVPSELVEKYLGHKGIGPIIYSSLVGVILPVCCIGALPIALTMHRKGARLGSVLAFLVATPATSVTALVVTWKLLGVAFTLAIFFGVIAMGVLLGIIGDGINTDSKHKDSSTSGCCHDHSKTTGGTIVKILRYSFITLPKEIGLEVIVGIGIASLLAAWSPLQQFIQENLVGAMGYVFVVVFGLITYVCSTASVPIADALVQSGMTLGQALCYLIVGPVTSYGTILVIRKEFGNHVLMLYLAVIISFSVVAGIAFDLFL